MTHRYLGYKYVTGRDNLPDSNNPSIKCRQIVHSLLGVYELAVPRAKLILLFILVNNLLCCAIGVKCRVECVVIEAVLDGCAMVKVVSSDT